MISLNTITSYKGTGSVLLDAQRTGLQSVGIKQHLKSFFNFGTARAENLDTLMAVRTAIRVDPRFSSTDIQDHADRLLAEVRTDRAIDVSRIKGIVLELEKLAHVSGSNIGKRVDLHVAAGDYTAVGLSDFIDKHADQVAFVAKQRADKVADDAQTAAIVANATADVRYIPVDVAGCVMDAAANCQAVLDSVSNVPDANTRDLVDFAAKHLGQLVLKNDSARRPNTFRTPVEIADIGRFCAQASRGGHTWIHESNPIGIIHGEPELVGSLSTDVFGNTLTQFVHFALKPRFVVINRPEGFGDAIDRERHIDGQPAAHDTLTLLTASVQPPNIGRPRPTFLTT